MTAVKSLKHQLSEMFGQTFTSLYVEFIMSCIRADYFFNFCHFSAGFVLFLKLQGALYNYVNVHAYRICGFLLHIYMCLDDLHVTCWCHLIFNRYMFGFVI